MTLNLPRVALESKTQNDFFDLLSERMEQIKVGLDYTIDTVRKAVPENAPILYKHGATGKRLNDDDDVIDIFKNGRATISFGYIGIYETVAKFYGGNWYDNPEAKEFSLDVMRYMNDRVAKWRQESEEGWWYSMYSTPAENLCFRFAKLDKEEFGDIKDITDKGYYTNSFHVDVRRGMNAFDKIDFEKEFSPYATGGFIHYVEQPNLNKNPRALEDLWDYAYDRVGYFGVNSPIDKCYKCGFEGEFIADSGKFICPQCDNSDPAETSCIRRLCGYLGEPSSRPVNEGKYEEMNSRTKHV